MQKNKKIISFSLSERATSIINTYHAVSGNKSKSQSLEELLESTVVKEGETSWQGQKVDQKPQQN